MWVAREVFGSKEVVIGSQTVKPERIGESKGPRAKSIGGSHPAAGKKRGVQRSSTLGVIDTQQRLMARHLAALVFHECVFASMFLAWLGTHTSELEAKESKPGT